METIKDYFSFLLLGLVFRLWFGLVLPDPELNSRWFKATSVGGNLVLICGILGRVSGSIPADAGASRWMGAGTGALASDGTFLETAAFSILLSVRLRRFMAPP